MASSKRSQRIGREMQEHSTRMRQSAGQAPMPSRGSSTTTTPKITPGPDPTFDSAHPYRDPEWDYEKNRPKKGF